MVNKRYSNGTVAVLYSPGYGAGWVSWNEEYAEFLAFDSRLVELALEGASQLVVEEYLKMMGLNDVYAGGWRDIRVVWVPKGTTFRITEYDGSEDIEYLGTVDWLTA